MDSMYSLRLCSSVRATSNPLSSSRKFGARGLQGKVSPIVKMVMTPREKISMLASYFDFSLLEVAGEKPLEAFKSRPRDLSSWWL